VLVEYFKELEEESIKDNFVIIYELLDEMMDFGYPQTTEPKVLQEYMLILVGCIFVLNYKRYITQSSYKLERGTPTVPIAATGGVSWRTDNIKYRRNEVFLDVIESVNYLVCRVFISFSIIVLAILKVNANGTVLRAEIIGSVKVNSKLSGMPELRLGLNDKVHFETTAEKSMSSLLSIFYIS
jgi:AP-1 complex subunit mu